MADNNVPIIDKTAMNLMGVEIGLCFDVDPQHFPDGIELIIMMPGALQPIGKIIAQKNTMLFATTKPEHAAHLRAGMQRELQRARDQAMRNAEKPN